MIGNTHFEVMLPDEYREQVKDICSRLIWTQSTLLRMLVDDYCPAIERRTAFPPLHIKRASSTYRFKALMDSSTNQRIERLCALRSWSHRDMMIHLLNNYMEATHG